MPKPKKVFNFTNEQLRNALHMASEGQTVQAIRKYLEIDAFQWYRYLQQNDTFSQLYDEARNNGLEELADSLFDIADKYDDIHRARLKSENIRWILSKRKSKIYGDRQIVDVNLLNLGNALQEAKGRAGLSDSGNEVIDVTKRKQDVMLEMLSDSESVDDDSGIFD